MNNRPDDFENKQGQQSQDPQNDRKTDAGNEENRQETRWYGVSYQNGNMPPINPFGPVKKSGKGKKIAVISLIVAVCLVFVALAGSVGYQLAIALHQQGSGDDPNRVSGNGTTMTDFHPNDGNEGYDYASVTLTKNDGSALTDWKKGSAGDAAMSRVEATAAVKDSVVEIMTETISNRGTVSAGAGSGVIVHADGIIITNNHVIDGASNVYVQLTNGETYEATVRGVDEDNDIAVIKIDPQETLTVAKLGCSGKLTLNEDVFAIGNPLGTLGGTVTNGYISALDREVNVGGVTMTLIQTDAAVNSGNSGGGLFNLAGELIGVVNAKYAASGVEGLAFAVPIDTAYVSVMHLLERGYIPDIPTIGAELYEDTVTFTNYTQKNMPYVSAVDGIHADSNLKVGDYIYAVDGTVIATEIDSKISSIVVLRQAIREYDVGDVITLTIYRNRQQTTVQVTLIEYIPDAATLDFE